MNPTHRPLANMLLTVAAAALCTGLQFTGIDTLAAADRTATALPLEQLPPVLVSARRAAPFADVQQLPQVVIVGRRIDRATATAQAADSAHDASI